MRRIHRLISATTADVVRNRNIRFRTLCCNQMNFSSTPESTPSVTKPPIHQQPPTARVSEIVNELASLTLLEVTDLTDILRTKLGVEEMPVMGIVMPGMSIGGGMRGKGNGAGKDSSAVEEKKEKTAFDLKLESFEPASKIKVIKEVRGFTDLGLKEAKELVEKTPTFLKKGITKEEAEKIVEKLAAVGAKVAMI
ncbi:putative 50S ribosomal protein L7/L12 [Zostera marina]|uniref:Putative 50S ribosomal protein L7/L12 n=1 Tax=Zostera marina TaxID=29655 RepID=A0A0K9PEB4_ZOSMR|nr:putative 50S ribosomal protein L7/L12 [Zostera marina]